MNTLIVLALLTVLGLGRMEQPGVAAYHQRYGYCAKGGHPKQADNRYVCREHYGPGLYTHCAVCGAQISAEPTRYYVCDRDVAR